MINEIFSNEHLKDTNHPISIHETGKKARIFQTFMSDAELAKRNIAITQPFTNDDIGKILVSGSEKMSHNVPILHAVQYSKFKGVVIDALIKRESNSNRLRLSFEERLRTLRSAAEEEGTPLSEASIDRGMRLLRSLAFNVKPSLYLAANGNLRIVWSNEAGEQIAFQIKGEKDEVQYVIFRRSEASERDQILGVMSSDNVIKLVMSLGLGRILFGEESIHVTAKC